MKWDQIVKVAIDQLETDAILTAIYAGNIRKMGTGSQLVPGLEWMKIGESEDELWNPVTFQWDQWCHTEDDLAASERQLRRHFHRDMPVLIGGVGMWVQYVDSGHHTDASRDNFAGGWIRFRYTPLREQYDPVS